MKVDHVAHWINERWFLLKAKERGETYVSPDYRMNEIRYCNVRREDDRVTKALRSSWMKPEDNGNGLPFIAYLARRLNTEKAFLTLPRPKNASFEHLFDLMDGKQGIHMKAGIYTVYPIAGKGHAYSDAFYTSENFKLYGGEDLRTETLDESFKKLSRFKQAGPFFTAQMIADLKRTKFLSGASDWWDWAAMGPGSKRGLNRIYGDDLESNSGNKEFLDRLKKVRDTVEPMLDSSVPRLCLQDWQNIMCETDKYLRFYDNPPTGKRYKSNNESVTK